MSGIIIVAAAAVLFAAAYGILGRCLGKLWKMPGNVSGGWGAATPLGYQMGTTGGICLCTGWMTVRLGWLPALAVLIAGSILMVGIQNYAVLYARVKGAGRSAQNGRTIGKGNWWGSLLVFIICILAASVLGEGAADLFSGFYRSSDGEILLDSANGTAAASCLILLVETAGLGVFLRYRNMNRIGKGITAGILISLAVGLGRYCPIYLEGGIWKIGVFLYGVAAVALPLWLLIRPGGILSFCLGVLLVSIAAVGIVAGNPVMEIPMAAAPADGMELGIALLAAAAAYGTVTGFDGLMISGVTSGLLKTPGHIRPVALGSAFWKGFLGVLVVVVTAAEGKFRGISPAGFAHGVSELLSEKGISYDLVFTVLQLGTGYFLLMGMYGAVRAGSRAFVEMVQGMDPDHRTGVGKRKGRIIGSVLTAAGAWGTVWLDETPELLFQGGGILLVALMLLACGMFFVRKAVPAFPALLAGGVLVVIAICWCAGYLLLLAGDVIKQGWTFSETAAIAVTICFLAAGIAGGIQGIRRWRSWRVQELYKKALDIAVNAHQGQTDKGGQPYINHPLAVAAMLENPRDRVAALLHDVVEDTSVTMEELKTQFPEDITTAVDLLTKKPGPGYTYQNYLEKIRENPMACRVKLADLTHNMDLGRIPNPGPRDLERMEKYRKSQGYLKGEIKEL